jgi:hypothetical protein
VVGLLFNHKLPRNKVTDPVAIIRWKRNFVPPKFRFRICCFLLCVYIDTVLYLSYRCLIRNSFVPSLVGRLLSYHDTFERTGFAILS